MTSLVKGAFCHECFCVVFTSSKYCWGEIGCHASTMSMDFNIKSLAPLAKENWDNPFIMSDISFRAFKERGDSQKVMWMFSESEKMLGRIYVII